MKKNFLIITLLLAGHASTIQAFGVMGALMIAKKAGQTKEEIMAVGQTKIKNVSKNQMLVSDNPYVVSIKQNKNKRKFSITARKAGRAFIAQIKQTENREAAPRRKAKIKGFYVTVARRNFPNKMMEGKKVYVSINAGDTFKQDNTNNDDAGRIKTKHITAKSVDGTKHRIVKLHAKDDGPHDVQVLNETTREMHEIKVDEDNEDDD